MGEFWRIVEVILHIGAHRTATTTFQTMLDRNRDNLAKIGIAVCTPQDTRMGLFEGLVCHPGQIDDTRRSAADASLARLRRCLDAAERDGMTQFLVSEENMIGSMNEMLTAGAFYPTARPRLRRFAPAFASRCNRIAVGMRGYDAWLASVLAYARMAGLPTTRREAVEGAARGRGWRGLLADAAAAFPLAERVVWDFDDWCARPGALLAALTGRDDLPPLAGADGWHNAGQGGTLLDRALRARLNRRWQREREGLACGAGGHRWLTPADIDDNRGEDPATQHARKEARP